MNLKDKAQKKLREGVILKKSFQFDLEEIFNRIFKRRNRHEKDINIKHPDEFAIDSQDK